MYHILGQITYVRVKIKLKIYSSKNLYCNVTSDILCIHSILHKNIIHILKNQVINYFNGNRFGPEFVYMTSSLQHLLTSSGGECYIIIFYIYCFISFPSGHT